MAIPRSRHLPAFPTALLALGALLLYDASATRVRPCNGTLARAPALGDYNLKWLEEEEATLTDVMRAAILARLAQASQSAVGMDDQSAAEQNRCPISFEALTVDGKSAHGGLTAVLRPRGDDKWVTDRTAAKSWNVDLYQTKCFREHLRLHGNKDPISNKDIDNAWAVVHLSDGTRWKKLAMPRPRERQPLDRVIQHGLVGEVLTGVAAMQDRRARVVNNMTVLHRAAIHNQVPLIRALLELDPTWVADTGTRSHVTPIFLAAHRGNEAAVLELSQHMSAEELGMQDVQGRTVLMTAADKGSIQVMQALLERMSAADIEQQDQRGRTALTYAVEAGDQSCVAAIVERTSASAFAAQADNGFTALHFAAYYGRASIIQELLPHTSTAVLNLATANMPGIADKVSALIIATNIKHEDAVWALLSRDDLELGAQTSTGLTPLMCATNAKLDHIAFALQSRMSSSQLGLYDKRHETVLHYIASSSMMDWGDFAGRLASRMTAADVGMQGASGETALHRAVSMPPGAVGPSVVHSLLRFMTRDQMLLTDERGLTAEQVARENRNFQYADAIKAAVDAAA